MLGVMPPEEAVKIAKSHGLDLVEVAATHNLQFAEFWNLGSTSMNLAKTKEQGKDG